jgi:type II secretory pathway pseudopilin PulG
MSSITLPPNKRSLICCRLRRSRRGYTYIMVMISAIIVSTLAMSAVWATRKHQLEQTAADQAYELASAADSAIELALARIAANPNWRNSHVHNTEYGPFTLGDVSLFYRLLDSEGNIGTGRLRDVTVIGIAKRGTYSYAAQVEVTPAGPALTFLNHGFSTIYDVDMKYRCTWTNNGSFHFDDDLRLQHQASLSGVVNVVDSLVLDSGSYMNGPATTSVPKTSFANVETLNRYIEEATNISITSLPTVSGRRRIGNCVLSPNHNPFGSSLNSKGIYRINCSGQNIELTNCRILGTLVLQNLGSNSRIFRNVYAQPFIANYPSLYIDGDIDIDTRWGNFSESSIGTNLNPVGAPYQGSTNSTQNDIYPSRIDGLFYTRGEVWLEYDCELEIDGVFRPWEITTNSDTSLRINYNSDIAANPPPGFRQDTIMRPIQGTYQRVATP